MKLLKNILLVLALLSATAVSLLDCSGRVKTFSSITVTPAESVISLPTPTPEQSVASLPTVTLQFKATGRFQDGLEVDATKSVTWSSSDTSVAIVSNGTDSQGLATIIAAGTASITATGDVSGVSGAAALTVVPVPLPVPQTAPSSSPAAPTVERTPR
jgi:Big-like domain-containing protein